MFRDALENPFSETLFNELHTSILILNRQKKVVYLNPSAERLLAVSSQAATGKSLGELLGQSDQALTLHLQEVLQSGRTVYAHEIPVSTCREKLLLQVEIAPLSSPQGTVGALLWMRDLSMEHVVQEERRVLDRLSMMGTLSSGLAHEIRNPLGGIRGAAQMLQRSLSSAEDQEYAQIIVSEVDRLNQLITQLLDFAKPQKLEKTEVNINQILSQLLLLQKENLAARNISLRQEFDPSMPPVWGHEDSLRQAFLNLIKNAIEAMEAGGNLKVSTGYISDYHMQDESGRAMPVAQVSVSDTGVGIPKEHLDSLFTPFFTTKPQGSGLGLMMTQRILKEHESQLRVSSQVGTGTTFKVLLKLAQEFPEQEHGKR
ncbi:MAG TPA: PAS domain-containing sensor histidine kinase [Deltaproteobacteria bacterium]|nr:PAS domain-containing sensor histidine kinase [Deltaproteobacteria bacterium]